MNIRYRVDLSDAERAELEALLRGGRHAARKLKRAQILLAADAGMPDETLPRASASAARPSTGPSAASWRAILSRPCMRSLARAPLASSPAKEEALLVATACSRPPAGRARWTIELLAGEMVRLTEHESLSRETVRRRLAENELKPWREKMWCVPKIDGEYVARMEDVLDLYAEPPDPTRPVVCLDESPVQLIGEVREPIPAAPGQIARVDYEYRRNGTVNLFVVVDAHRSWRKVNVTERRTAQDYAECLRELVDVDYPDAACIRVVQDNLSTHTPGALYETFPAAEAHRILERLEFHYTPKHASWLNMVEIEIGVLKPVPGPAHRQPRGARRRDRRLGAPAQRRPAHA